MINIKRHLENWNQRRRLNRRRRRFDSRTAAGVMDIPANWLNGKSVAIIGPAKGVEDDLIGHAASDFDVIVRLNKGAQLALGRADLWGPRTDVLFHNLKEDSTDRSAGRIDDTLLAQSGLASIVFPHASPEKWGKSSEIAARRLISQNDIDFLMPRTDLYADVQKELGGLTPTTGFMAIATFLSLKPRKLAIFGISFFSTGYVAEYAASAQADANPIDWARATGLHDPQIEARVCAQMLMVHARHPDAFPVILGDTIRERLEKEGLEGKRFGFDRNANG